MFWNKKLIRIEDAVTLMRIEMENFNRVFDSFQKLIRESQIQTDRYMAEARKSRAFTFSEAEIFGLTPEYGKTWSNNDIKIGDPTLGKRKKKEN